MCGHGGNVGHRGQDLQWLARLEIPEMLLGVKHFSVDLKHALIVINKQNRLAIHLRDKCRLGDLHWLRWRIDQWQTNHESRSSADDGFCV